MRDKKTCKSKVVYTVLATLFFVLVACAGVGFASQENGASAGTAAIAADLSVADCAYDMPQNSEQVKMGFIDAQKTVVEMAFSLKKGQDKENSDTDSGESDTDTEGTDNGDNDKDDNDNGDVDDNDNGDADDSDNDDANKDDTDNDDGDKDVNAGEESEQATAQEASEKQKPALDTSALSAIMVENSTGKVLFEKEPGKRLPMASVTKIMTSLLAIEALERGDIKLTDTVVTSEYAASMGGSQVFLEPGEEMTVKDMLLGVMVGSANDASVAIAEHIAGSEEAFLQMMNDRAKDLGMADTHYSNPTGLPIENHYTTAYDLSQLMREVVKHEQYKEFAGIKEYDLRGGEFKLWNLNKLLWWYSGVDLGKTGWTNEASYCLASSAEREGLRLIVAVLGVPETRGHFRESIKIYNYGFARYKAVNIAEKNALIENIPVEKGMIDNVDIVTEENVGVVVEKGGEKRISSEKSYSKKLVAPITKGQKVGEYVVLDDKKEVLKINLVAAENIEKASIPVEMFRVMNKVYRLK